MLYYYKKTMIYRGDFTGKLYHVTHLYLDIEAPVDVGVWKEEFWLGEKTPRRVLTLPATQAEYEADFKKMDTWKFRNPFRYHPRYSGLYIYNRTQRKHGMK